ncbi:MAG: hypothetical protein U1F87_03770 [Kiritimatiellia bacterium]
MRSILAIAGIALRASVRSRMVLALLLALATVVPGIAFTARGDGTAMGQVQVLLTYSLGACGLILSLATLWSACAAVSLEIENRQIHLLVAKPVHRWQVWLGKWLGLMILNALLLLLSGAVVAGILRHKTRPILIGAEESERIRENVLNARRDVPPRPFDLAAAAVLSLRAAVEQGRIAAEEAEGELANAIRYLNVTTNSAARGAAARWVFDLPATIPPGPVVLEFIGETGSIDRDDVPVVWSIGTPANPRIRSIEQALVPGARRTLDLPLDAVGASRAISIECFNAAAREVSVFFKPGEGVRVLLPGGGFAANLARALLLQWIRLGLLAALGVSAGSMFSMPVAALASISLILARQVTAFLDSATEGLGPSMAARDSGMAMRAFDHFSRGVYHLFHILGGRVESASALERLSQGVQVPWSEVARNAGLSIGVFGLLLFAAGAILLSRREVALPE